MVVSWTPLYVTVGFWRGGGHWWCSGPLSYVCWLLEGMETLVVSRTPQSRVMYGGGGRWLCPAPPQMVNNFDTC